MTTEGPSNTKQIDPGERAKSARRPLFAAGIGLVVIVLGGLGVLVFQQLADEEPIYRLRRSEHCSPERYAEGTGEICGEVFETRRDPVCGVELYKLEQGPQCGVSEDAAQFVPLKAIGFRGLGDRLEFCLEKGYAGHNGRKPNGHCIPFKRCRLPEHGIERYQACAREEFGFEGYATCRDESFGVSLWKKCRHPAHGRKDRRS